MRFRNAQRRLAELPEYGMQILAQPDQYRGQWRNRFGGQRLCLEIGTGRGSFIAGMAALDPECLYVGIERYAPVLVSAAKKIKDRNLPNAKLIHGDVRGLAGFFSSGEIETIYINFVDPWPKKRHAKRRLTHPDFLRLYKQVIRSGGAIHLKTDNEKLFEFSLNQFADAGCRLKDITFDLHNSHLEEANVWTEYETGFAEKNSRIYRCTAVIEVLEASFRH